MWRQADTQVHTVDWRVKNRFRYRVGWRALAIAALVLAAQLLAVAHVHQLAIDKGFHADTQAVVDDGLCALCLFHFNCPASSSPPLILARPTPVEVSTVATASNPLRSSVKSCQFGRAPPSASL